MALLVLLFVVAFASQHVLSQSVAEAVNTNIPQLNGTNNFFVSFDFESLAPTCCPGALPSCGDGKCNRTENCLNCPQDCRCLYCGDGLCLATDNESCTTCPHDCGACHQKAVCGDGVCTKDYEACSTCQVDCGACVVCGDGVCQFSENCDSCPYDCGGACPTGALVGGTVDLITGLPIQGALVETLNVRPGNEYYMITNKDGNFIFSLLPVQIVQLRATHPSYGLATASIQIPLNGLANITIYMVPALDTNSWKVRLTWTTYPTDFDLTEFGDWDPKVYQSGVVNWETSNKTQSLPNAFLSTDNTNGLGVEYITITKFGNPRQNVEFWVHDYSGERRNNSESFKISNARVIVWTGRLGLQGDWTVQPSTLGGNETWWHVFDITPTQQVVPVNRFFNNTSAAPCGYVQYCPYRPMDLFLRKRK